MKRVLTIPAMLVLLLAASLFVQAQQQEKPKREPGAAAETGKHHVLAATRETTQWGWLAPNEKPKLTVDSGDTVSIETLLHSLDHIQPGMPMEEIGRLRLANPSGGPHSRPGPSYVSGAGPGGTMA